MVKVRAYRPPVLNEFVVLTCIDKLFCCVASYISAVFFTSLGDGMHNQD